MNQCIGLTQTQSLIRKLWWRRHRNVTCGKRIRNNSSSLFGSYWVLWGASLNSLWRSFSFLRWVFTCEKLRRMKSKQGEDKNQEYEFGEDENRCYPHLSHTRVYVSAFLLQIQGWTVTKEEDMIKSDIDEDLSWLSSSVSTDPDNHMWHKSSTTIVAKTMQRSTIKAGTIRTIKTMEAGTIQTYTSKKHQPQQQQQYKPIQVNILERDPSTVMGSKESVVKMIDYWKI